MIVPKLDLKKELKDLYNASRKELAIIDVPPMNFLMIDGAGSPETSPQFQAAVQALYGVSYTLKFMIKKTQGADYVVMPLEGLWWAEDMEHFSLGNKDQWQWTLMIMQPEYVTEDLVAEAVEQVREKKDSDTVGELRFEGFHEGVSAQIMYVGPYSDEGPTIARLHCFIEENGYSLRGKHHEIYLGDPRRAAPDKLKTILRQPMG